MPNQYRIRLLPLFATLIVVALGLLLAQWQTRRALEKEGIEAKLLARQSQPPVNLTRVTAPEELEYRRVRIKGSFEKSWPLYLDNRPYNGKAGLYAAAPFKIEGTDQYVMVLRGWLPRNPTDRTRLPPDTTPSGELTIEGAALRHAGRLLELGKAEALKPNAIVQNLDLDELAAVSRLKLAPLVIEQTSDTGDGLVRDWPRPSQGSEKHRAYAFQWYALAATALIFYVVTGIRRGKN